MSNGDHAAYTFLPVVRQGVIATIETANPQLTVRVNDRYDVPVPIRLYGPGDVTGIDPRVVVRTEPRHLTAEFEDNYLAAIEFDRPDFPWLFSPPQPANQDKVSPWICLVVVVKEADKEKKKLQAGSGTNLPVLTCSATELPDLRELWAWGHAQALRNGQPIDRVLTRKPELNVSRLLCPRKLNANEQYSACLVPAFKAGVEAGLGLKVTSDRGVLAWDGSEPALQLPVYYYWEFGTSAADFETLARRLQPALRLPHGVGQRDLDLNSPGFGLPPGGVVSLGGALRSLSTPLVEWPVGRRAPFQEKLTQLLNAAEEGTPDSVPRVAPPIYGRWHAGRLVVTSGPPPWLRDLNLDPCHRVVASVGARVVQEQQEQLMASAWEQLGEIQRANQLLRHTQLARSVGETIHQKRFQAIRHDRLLHLSAAVLGQVRSAAQPKTIRQLARESSVGEAALSPAFRRTIRPRGPIARKMLGSPSGAPSLVQRLASAQITAAPPRRVPGGMGTTDTASEMAAAAPGPRRSPPRITDLTPEVLRRAPRPRRPTPAEREPLSTERFREAAALQQPQVLRAAAIADIPAKPAFSLDTAAAALLTRLDPKLTIPERIKGIVNAPEQPGGFDAPLEPIMARPEFPQPMIEPLKALSQDLILPGLHLVPPDIVAEIEINWPFIEAYMLGLNHEMSRELLWREFPTDQRGTYFKRFWDTTGSAAGAAEAAADIGAIESWTGPLGNNPPEGSAASLLVLLIRGELLRRYPGAIIYAVKAKRDGGRRLSDEERYPMFRGSLDPDVVFVGFSFSAREAVGGPDAEDAGWYLVVQEQPTEPRFGFETSRTGGAVGDMPSWRGLSWDDVAGHVGENGHLKVVGPLGSLPAKQGVTWGLNSAHMATIGMQSPFRIGIHLSQLLPSDEEHA